MYLYKNKFSELCVVYYPCLYFLVIFVMVFCVIVAVIMIIGAARQQSMSLYSYNSRTNRNYSNPTFDTVRSNGKRSSTAERSTLLLSSDDEF